MTFIDKHPDLTLHQRVVLFHEAFNQPVPNAPTMDAPLKAHHRKIMREEYMELEDAADDNDMVEFVDGLVDTLVTAHSRAAGHGLNLDKFIPFVTESNMSKLGEDGKPVYYDNGEKAGKGPNYFAPTELIKAEIERQRREGSHYE